MKTFLTTLKEAIFPIVFRWLSGIIFILLFSTATQAQINEIYVPSSSFINIPNNESIRIPVNFTLEAMVNLCSTDGNQVVISKQLCDAGYSFYLSVNQGKLFYSWRNSGTGNDCKYNTNTITGSTSISPDVWTHIAVVHENTGISLYVNGTPDAVSMGESSKTIEEGINLSTTDLRIGAYQGLEKNFGAFVNGGIDEVRIWNIARSQAQIKATSNTSLSGNENGLVAYYNFDFTASGENVVVPNKATNTGNILDGKTVNSGASFHTSARIVGEIKGLNDTYCQREESVKLIGIPAGGSFQVNGVDASSLSLSKAGTFNIVYTYHNETGCSKTVSKTVTINTLTASILNREQEYCAGDYDVQLTAQPTGGVFSINGAVASSNIFVPKTPGTFEIIYTCTNSEGCKAIARKTVTVKECCQYQIGNATATCGDIKTILCVPLTATYPVSRGITGMDYCLEYDPKVLIPTGTATLGNVVTKGNASWGSYYLNTTEAGKVRVSIHYSLNAPSGANWSGSGDVICVNFQLHPDAKGGTNANFTSCELEEAYKLKEKPACWKPGKLTVNFDSNLRGKLIYQGNVNKPLGMNYKVTNPNMAQTIISGTNENCTPNTPSTLPDAAGEFSLSTVGVAKLKMNRDIKKLPQTLTYNNLRYINGFDAYQMELIATKQTSAPYYLTPTPYMMIAADVNMNGKVRSNDITLVMERTVKKINEYPQVWNSSTPDVASLDWRFIDKKTVDSDPAFKISGTYPASDAVGFHRDQVPNVPFCLPVEKQCLNSERQLFSGILLGDLVDGGPSPALLAYPVSGDPYLRVSSDAKMTPVLFIIDNINQVAENTYRVEVRHQFSSENPLVSLDFSFDYDKSRISIVDFEQTQECIDSEANVLENVDEENGKFLVTSYSTIGFPAQGSLFYFDIYKADGKPVAEDFLTALAIANGNEVPAEIQIKTITEINSAISAENIGMSPNPANTQTIITLPATGEMAIIQIINSLGQTVATYKSSNDKQIAVNVADLSEGVYQCIIGINDKSVVKKLVVKK